MDLSQGRWRMAGSANVLLAVATAVAFATPAIGTAQQKTPNPNRKTLPAAITKAIEDNRPGAEIDKLDVEKEHGLSFYDIEFKAGKGEMDVAEDGTVLNIATIIEMKDVPEAAAAAIRTAGKGRPIKQLERSEVRAEIVNVGGKARISKLATPRYVYEAEFSNGEVEVTPEGKVIKAGK
jgi:hypothetical protein